jgi:hypothetical protein
VTGTSDDGVCNRLLILLSVDIAVGSAVSDWYAALRVSLAVFRSQCLRDRKGIKMQATIGDIDGCEYLYLEFAYEGGDHRLRLLITEAEVTDKVHHLVIGGTDFASNHIEHTAYCRCFEVTWPNSIAYSIRNESYCGPDGYEQFNGRSFVLYSKSRYLDFVSAATIATKEYPGPFKHWGIFTLNHVIDVVSTDEPSVRIVQPKEYSKLRRWSGSPS